jgi:hypothetical protein
MVGAAAYHRLHAGLQAGWALDARPNMALV